MSKTPDMPDNASDNELTAAIVVEHVRELSLVSSKRTYECQAPLSSNIGGGVTLEKLPEAGHWRLSVTGKYRTYDATGVALTGTCTAEAVIFLRNFKTPEDVRQIMVNHFAGQLLGTVRARLQSVSLMTGFAPILFPILSRDEMARFCAEVVVNEV